MSDTIALPGRYGVVFHDEGIRGDAGIIDVAADGRLTVVSAAPDFAVAISVIVANMNAMQAETVRARPPDGAPKYSLWSRTVPRDSPQFIATMFANIRRQGFEMIPEAAG
jgi:hypothetical protein